MSAAELRFSFLTAGPRFRVFLPMELSNPPMLAAPLSSGAGPRSFHFRPSWRGLDRDRDAGEGVRYVSTLTDPAGRSVDMFQMETPLQWFLRWRLTWGVLWTHLREEDGFHRIAGVLSNLEIVEDEITQLPFLLPRPPLFSRASARPGYQERATFARGDGQGSVLLQRPSFLNPGEIRAEPSPGQWLRAGTPYGIEVQVACTADEATARGILDQVMDSLTEDSGT